MLRAICHRLAAQHICLRSWQGPMTGHENASTFVNCPYTSMQSDQCGTAMALL
jgi:hypothetical protein